MMLINSTKNTEKYFAMLYCLIVSTLFIGLCSTSSPLYPFNVWNDSNCFMTVGKAMFDGQVVYADIYEQKGIFLYFLHGMASLMSATTFFGVYIIEVLFFFVFLYYSKKIIDLFLNDKAYLFILPVLSALILTDQTFVLGDSAEEFALPFYAVVLYHAVLKFTEGNNSYSWKQALIDGIMIGCVFWIKFNLIAFFACFILVIMLELIIKKQLLNCAKYVGTLFLGFLISTIPWVIYFAVNNALFDWVYNYFYSNIFLFSTEESTYSKIMFIKNVYINFFTTSGAMAVLGLIGVIAMLFVNRKINSNIYRISFFGAYVLMMAGIWIGGRNSTYYGFGLAVFTLLGLIICFGGIEKICDSLKNKKFICACIAFLLLILVPFTYYSTNFRSLMHMGKSQLAQYQFAEIMNKNENPTLLNYGSLDGGFYTAADITPTCKYFCMTNNKALTEMGQTQARFVREKKTDFVVTCSEEQPPTFLTDNYELISEKEDVYGSISYVFRLYEKK